MFLIVNASSSCFDPCFLETFWFLPCNFFFFEPQLISSMFLKKVKLLISFPHFFFFFLEGGVLLARISRIFTNAFVPNKSFRQLIAFSKTYNAEFTEIEDKVNSGFPVFPVEQITWLFLDFLDLKWIFP